MGSTPRPSLLSIPMLSRNSDVSALKKCPASWILGNFFEDEQADATYFVNGNALHVAFENVAKWDDDFDQALASAYNYLDEARERWDSSGVNVIETAKRTREGQEEDIARVLAKWFQDVHPDSKDRFPEYEPYDWPFLSEVPFYAKRHDTGTKYDIWGSIDALWTINRQPAAMTDWKTGATPKADQDQLFFYEFGMRHSGIYLPPELPKWFHHADGLGKKGKLQRPSTKYDGVKVKNRIRVAEMQKDSDDWPAVPEWYCNYCTVREFCPLNGKAEEKALTRMLDLRVPMTEPYEG